MFKNFFFIVNKNAHQVSQQVLERNLGKLDLKGFLDLFALFERNNRKNALISHGQKCLRKSKKRRRKILKVCLNLT